MVVFHKYDKRDSEDCLPYFICNHFSSYDASLAFITNLLHIVPGGVQVMILT